jgi:hypothetical protein
MFQNSSSVHLYLVMIALRTIIMCHTNHAQEMVRSQK